MKIQAMYGRVNLMYSGRNELSKKNKYYLPKYRFLELKYFCLQYDNYRKEYESVTYYRGVNFGRVGYSREMSDNVADAVERMNECSRKMEMIEQACIAADPELYPWLLKSVTAGLGYQYLIGIPCCKDTFYDRYHKFFWILSQKVQALY